MPSACRRRASPRRGRCCRRRGSKNTFAVRARSRKTLRTAEDGLLLIGIERLSRCRAAQQTAAPIGVIGQPARSRFYDNAEPGSACFGKDSAPCIAAEARIGPRPLGRFDDSHVLRRYAQPARDVGFHAQLGFLLRQLTRRRRERRLACRCGFCDRSAHGDAGKHEG